MFVFFVLLCFCTFWLYFDWLTSGVWYLKLFFSMRYSMRFTIHNTIFLLTGYTSYFSPLFFTFSETILFLSVILFLFVIYFLSFTLGLLVCCIVAHWMIVGVSFGVHLAVIRWERCDSSRWSWLHIYCWLLTLFCFENANQFNCFVYMIIL